MKESDTVKVGEKILKKTVFNIDYWAFSFLDEFYKSASYTLAIDAELINEIGYDE